MFILDDILCWLPLRGVVWVAGKLEEVVTREQENEQPIMEAILENELAFEEGTVDRATYDERQRDLLAALRAIKERKRGAAAAPKPISGKASIEVDVDLDRYGRSGDQTR